MAKVRIGGAPWAPVALVLLFSLPLLVGGVRADAEEMRSPEDHFRSARDQGKHYFKKKAYPQARLALERARTIGPGPEDFSTHDFLARTYYKLYMLEDAFPTARRALELARSEEQQEGAARLIAELDGQFGGVRFAKDPDQQTELKETYIYLKETSGLINPEKKRIFGLLQARWQKTKVNLPLTVYLPFGSYKANGAPFEVAQGQTAEAALFMYLDPPGTSPWLWVGIAGGAALVAGGVVAAVLLAAADEERPQEARFGTISFLPEQAR